MKIFTENLKLLEKSNTNYLDDDDDDDLSALGGYQENPDDDDDDLSALGGYQETPDDDKTKKQSGPKTYLYSKEELQDEILSVIMSEYDPDNGKDIIHLDVDFNNISVDKIDDLSELFYKYYNSNDSEAKTKTSFLRRYYGDISGWTFADNVNVDKMFACSSVKSSTIEKWDVSKFDKSTINPFTLFLGRDDVPSWIKNFKVVATNAADIQKIIKNYIELCNNEKVSVPSVIDLTCVDVSNVADMSYLFSRDLSKPMSNSNAFTNKESFSSILGKAKVNISEWDMSGVENTSFMFANFNCSGYDLSKWEFSDAWKKADYMFSNSSFDGKNISDGSSVLNCESLESASFMFNGVGKLVPTINCSSMICPKVIEESEDVTEIASRFKNMFNKMDVDNMPEWYVKLCDVQR